MNIIGQDSNNGNNDIWALMFNLEGGENQLPTWEDLKVGGTLPEMRYGGHGGVYPMTGLSFWLGFGFKKGETGKRLGDTFRMTFTNTSTISEIYQ